ncbi:MAG TPA: outer membrane protein assembly factor BamA [Steroidobacteraceae bacterium]|jgi:outer membrane protein insertion porin family
MRATLRTFSLLIACLLARAAYAQETTQVAPAGNARDFVVGDIRIEGLQRISEGTVFNYLPVNIGDTLDRRRIAEAVQALYATKFFKDVELRRDGNVLVIAVLERPTIESFEVKGNKDIKTEDLEKSLRNVGLASGKSFDQSVLDEVKQYLTDQYFSRGKYAVRVDTKAEDVPGNKVKVAIDIHEGDRARIQQINIVGNSSVSDDELLGQLQLRPPNWLSWYRQDDRYAKEALNADLETLRSYYMDRGYADFAITSSQVTIGPERDDIFITVNVKEGAVYRISDVKLAGETRVPESELRRLIVIHSGETYSQRLITQSTEAIRARLGLDGYAFAKIDAVPKLDEAGRQVALSLVVDPGNRVYVRRINFLGTTSVNDEVFRREMRQLEGSYLSNAAVERSKIRLQRLPFIEKVEVETTPVPGTPDLVDVDFTLKEGLPGQFGGGIGYSGSQGLLLQGNIVHTNLFGTGQRLALEVSGGAYSQVYDVSYTDPYFLFDGVGRTVSFSYRDVDRLTSSFSQFSTKLYTASSELFYDITELQTIRFGTSLEHAELATPLSSSTQLQDWVRHNGDPFFRLLSGGDFVLGTQYDAVELSAGWGRDSRNRVLFPTQGALARLQLSATVPGIGSVEYLRSTFQYQQFFRLPLVPLTFSFNSNLSYSMALGDTDEVPPNRHFFVGGPDSVRGFHDFTLGPRDSLGNPYGGDAALSGQLEAILPTPAKFANSARGTLFLDFGQAYYLGDTEFTDKAGFPVDYGFDLKQLRASVGIGVQWLAPLGLFRFSYAVPIRYHRETWRDYGDQLESFQFSVGRAF